MKANTHLRLLALVAVLAAAPLGAAEAAAAPATPAPAAARASEERIATLAEAQLDIKKRILAIMGSDRTEAEKLAAIRAMHAECKSIGSKCLAAGMARVLRKAKEIGLPTYDDRMSFARWSAGVGIRDKALTQAIEDATSLTKGLPTLAAIMALTPEQVADAFISTMETCTNHMLREDLSNGERVDFLEEMQHRLSVIYSWAKETGKASEVTAILQTRFGVRSALNGQGVASQLSLASNADLATAARNYLIALDGLTRLLYPQE